MNNRWIWQQDNYPNFEYNKEEIFPLLSNVETTQNQIIKYLKHIHEEDLLNLKIEAYLNEIVNNSKIENEFLNESTVNEFVKEKLIDNYTYKKNKDLKTKKVVDILFDSIDKCKEPLDIEKIFAWHSKLFPLGHNAKFESIDVGELRGNYEMKIISGSGQKEKVHYIAPPFDTLFDEMIDFFDWFNSTDDSLIKAAIAHLWFLIIHPLDDGNGRITRTITEYTLSRTIPLPRIYSLSKSTYKTRKEYYKVLDETTGFRKKENPLDITLWLKYFLNTIQDSFIESKKRLKILDDKRKFWEKHKNDDLNDRQIKVINKILDIDNDNFEGKLNLDKYLKITKTTIKIANKDIEQLFKKNCIEVNLQSIKITFNIRLC